ncbi:hypothetical protein G7Y89_g12941 [Cudoniella acicularis]|uniref:G protein-coupled receptor GPR1/2/3 C-terminal domain-containing protein n=1 Tax=Cudoniella acicularis TaxID=354080 RepID=A0A8H4VWJ0_9HELO|nr:hypothetical protein G7Y89_g12941 [Cudoniella acicularis]
MANLGVVATQYATTSIDPLPQEIRHGMIAMGLMGLLSTLSTLSLIVFITYRMLNWRRYYEHPIATNQIFVLIYNLLLADFQQALSFLLTFYWLSQNKLVGPSNVCFAQGWLIQIGDLSSGLWVLAIAAHTFVSLVLQKQIPFHAFVGGVVSIWLFCLVLTAIGPIMHQKDFFVPAGVWCWIGENHESDRLTFHYLWIFVSQLGSLVIYISIFFFLRVRVASSAFLKPQHPVPSRSQHNSTYQASPISPTSPNSTNFSHPHPLGRVGTTTTIHSPFSPSNGHTRSHPHIDPFAASRQKILRTARYMVVYPFAYVALTLPLAAGRVSAMAHSNPSIIFYCIAGTLMSSCGIVDVALYIYTRKALVRSNVGIKSGMSRAFSVENGAPPSEGEETWRGDGSGERIRMDGLRETSDDLSTEHKEGLKVGSAIGMYL